MSLVCTADDNRERIINLNNDNVSKFGFQILIRKEHQHKDDYVVSIRFPDSYKETKFSRIYLASDTAMFPELFGKKIENNQRLFSFNMTSKALKTVQISFLYTKPEYTFYIRINEFL